jgi:predicted peroxiredoxin
MTSGDPRPSWVLLLRRGDEDSLYEAAAMAASAISLGLEVTLVWLDAALEALASGRLADTELEPRSAGRLLREARETGRLRSLACSASLVRARAAGSGSIVGELVDDVVGWPTAISLIRAAERSFVW